MDSGFLPGTTVFADPPGPWSRATDPSVAYDPAHDVWMVNILAMTGTTGKAILVSRSTDGGLTFGNPVTVDAAQGNQFFDKNWIACDTSPSSPFYGTCYTEWDDANTGNKLDVARSTDGGLSWTPSSVPSASVVGGQPLVQPDGTVVMPIDNGSETSVNSFVSADGGASFQGPFRSPSSRRTSSRETCGFTSCPRPKSTPRVGSIRSGTTAGSARGAPATTS